MKFRGAKGFALPTILIVSVILMSVLVLAAASVSGVRSSMAAQSYNQMAKNAADAGIAYAKACLDSSVGIVSWSEDKPLRPFTDCAGNPIVDSSSPDYYVSTSGNVKSTFSVVPPSLDDTGQYESLKASGSVNLTRVSSGAVWRTYSQYTTFTFDYIPGGGINLLDYGAIERTSSNEWLRYSDLAPIIDKYGASPQQYTVSFDIKSANVSSASTMAVYMHNGGDFRYKVNPGNAIYVPVTTTYTRQAVTFVPTLVDASVVESYLAFFGTYGTGNIPSVKNVKVELGPRATPWAMAPGEASVLIVGGGGSGGSSATSSGGAGGGGGGGVLYNVALKLNTEAPYPITVGAGGSSVSGGSRGISGGNSSFANLVAYGGGGGGAGSGASHAGLNGGSGGGAGYNIYALSTPGAGISGQGSSGGQNGATEAASGGGGGGAGGVGGVAGINHVGQHEGGYGGAGRSIEIAGTSVNYAAGGFGGGVFNIYSGAPNTGNGGSGVYGSTAASGAGGSGVVIIAYSTGSMAATGGDITYSNGYTIHTFKTNGTFTVQSIAN